MLGMELSYSIHLWDGDTECDVCSAEPWAKGDSPLPRANMKTTQKYKVPQVGWWHFESDSIGGQY